jgi:endoglucanase
MKELIKEFCSASFVSGYEISEQNNVLSGCLQQHNVPYEIDAVGNVVFRKTGKGERTLMLVAHYDEIGFAVKYIDDNGYVYFSAVGGVDTSILRGQKVIIIHDGQPVAGVIGSKPIHMINQKRNEKNHTDISDLWIDIGVKGKEEVGKYVSVGDLLSFYPNFTELNDGFFTSKSIDNRVGIAVLLSVYEKIRNVDVGFKCIYFVLSSQEELGLRGARAAGYAINPETCIAIDVTHATDYPSINKSKYGDVKLNQGAVIPLGSNFSTSVQKCLRRIADENSVPYQIESIPGCSGTDISEIQLTRGGCRTGLISIPCRYMHTPVEMASYDDMDAAISILSAFCRGTL